MEITRRSLISSAAACAAGACVAAAVRPTGAQAAETGKAGAARSYAAEASSTLDCDVCVVGAGMSGLSAAVEALNQGAKVVVLESQEAGGGNGNVTSCVMGVGTDLQKKLGIEVTPAQVMETEMQTFNYSVDGVRWEHVIADSPANLDWLVEQGCLMRDDFVDNYKGTGVLETAHWWVGETQRDGNNGFVTPMVARVEELGGTLVYQTAGKQLIQDASGAVTGLYAEGPDGVVQVNAKAVILATGGYADNMDMLAERGFNTDELAVFGAAGHAGDGIQMALAAGGKSWLENSSLMEYPMNPGIGMPSAGFSHPANAIWVNGLGQRYVNENCAAAVPGRAMLAVRSQERSYVLLDQPLMDALCDGDEDRTKVIEDAVESGDIFKADTIEELAEAAGIDADTLAQTVADYNELCAAGEDTTFGKGAEFLTAVETAPFYLNCNSGTYFLTTIGGIDTTPDCEVRSAEGGVIGGLYAAGVDGVELYAASTPSTSLAPATPTTSGPAAMPPRWRLRACRGQGVTPGPRDREGRTGPARSTSRAPGPRRMGVRCPRTHSPRRGRRPAWNCA